MKKEVRSDIKLDYKILINNIGKILEEGRRRAFKVINETLIKTYWGIGRQIIEFEQKGKEKAEYGSSLLTQLSRDLKLMYGKVLVKDRVLSVGW